MYDSIIIGAGQAGLAIAYYLQQENQKFLLIDKAREIGESWKDRYDSLLLFTPRMYSSLPGLPIEGDGQGCPTKDEVVDYLKKYVETYTFPIHLNEEVINVAKENDEFLIETNQREYKAKNVIVATGPFQTPKIPNFSKELSTNVLQLHSSQYKNSNQLVEGNVLVVGGGNSGAQIAVELSKVKETYLAVSKKPVYLPLEINHKSIFWWFDKLGVLKVNRHSLLGKIIQKKGDPIFGLELKQAIKNKEIIMKQRVIGAKMSEIFFEADPSLKVRNIIWATGFKSTYPWLKIDGVIDKAGKVKHNRGETKIKGLYFIGLPWQYRRGSALLQGVGEDASYIVRKLTDGDLL